MNLLGKLFAPKKKHEKQLKHGDRILVEFGRDRKALYINMFDIPRTAQLLINLMGRSSLERRVRLPNIAKFMYDDYVAWTDTVEQSAESKSWGHIILMAYTTKVLQDDLTHDKALLTMIAKGEMVKYQHSGMFTLSDWNMLQLQVKAGDTRDEAMRQVLSRLFKRSVGLLEFLEIPSQQIIGMGLDWKVLHESTAVAKIVAPKTIESSIESTSLFGGAKDIPANDKDDISVADVKEDDALSIISLSTVGSIPDAETKVLSSTITAPTQIEHITTVDTAVEENAVVTTDTEWHVVVAPKVDEHVAVTTETEKHNTVTKETEKHNTVIAGTWKHDKVNVETEKHDKVNAVPEKHDNVDAETEEPGKVNAETEKHAAVTTGATKVPVPASLPTEESSHFPSMSPKLIRKLSNEFTMRQNDSDTEYKTVFTPSFEIPRTAPGSPTKIVKEFINFQKTEQVAGIETKPKPVVKTYQPPHRRQDVEASSSRWTSRNTHDNTRAGSNYSRGNGRQLPNLKYGKSVLNTQRAKQAVWPGDDPRSSNDTPIKSSTNWREPKGPAMTGDWKELDSTRNQPKKTPHNFVIGAPPRRKGLPEKRLAFSLEKGVHFVSCD